MCAFSNTVCWCLCNLVLFDRVPWCFGSTFWFHYYSWVSAWWDVPGVAMKLCKDCKYLEGELCMYDSQVHLVTGERTGRRAYTERYSWHPEACGPEGRFFLLKEDIPF